VARLHLDPLEAAALFEQGVARFPLDPSLGSGYAEILKAQGRYKEALARYDQIIQRFPLHVSSKIARAHIFKRLGDYESALNAYNNILEIRPDWASARTGKAGLLISMGKLDEAAELLPPESPKSQIEWSRYLLRALLLDARGARQLSREMLRQGTRRSPFARSRRLFSSVLAGFEIQEGKASLAVKTLESNPNDFSNVLRFHALAASGRTKIARQALDQIKSIESNVIYMELTREVALQYRIIEGTPAHDRNWIFKSERETFLAEAA